MGCMVLCRTFYTAPEQGPGPTPIVPHCSGYGPGPSLGIGHSQCDYIIRLYLPLYLNRVGSQRLCFDDHRFV